MARRVEPADLLWRQRPLGFNVGVLDPGYHRRPYMLQLKAANARLVRVFLRFQWDAVDRAYQLSRAVHAGLRELIGMAQQLGLPLVLVGDFESAPNPSLWQDRARADAFVQAWRSLARDLAGLDAVAGYDLINEPNPPWSDGRVHSARAEWWSLADRTMAAIRQQDAWVPIVFEPIGGGQAVGFEGLVPFSHANVVYSVHFYTPHGITHQGVGKDWPHEIPYPVETHKIPRESSAYPGPWNKDRLRQSLQPVVTFQQRHNVPVFVGEFSCVRWAPGQSALRYITDSLALFQEFGWSWCYHEFRGWPGWDAELEGGERMHGTRRADAPVMQTLQRELKAQWIARR